MARPGYALGMPRPQSLIITLIGPTLAAYIAQDFAFLMPQRAKVIGVFMNVAAVGGTLSTATVDVLQGTTSLLTAVFDVAAATPGTPVNKEIASLVAGALEVAKDTVMHAKMAVSGGSSPTASGLTIQIDYVPLGD